VNCDEDEDEDEDKPIPNQKATLLTGQLGLRKHGKRLPTEKTTTTLCFHQSRTKFDPIERGTCLGLSSLIENRRFERPIERPHGNYRLFNTT
jgi:hypothetical protein